MSQPKIEDFQIEHLDPQAQGVSKISDKVTFIPKSLPGESGKIKITHEKSKIKFGEILEVKESSPNRIKPECKHYQDCNGCHYLHTSYEQEILFKTQAFERIIQKLAPEIQIEVHKNKERFGNRNRIQLHYDQRANKLGFFKAFSHSITPIENCLTASRAIQEKLSNFDWQQLILTNKKQGHIELYEKDSHVEVNINSPYSKGGFSQVNEKINQIMIDFVNKSLTPSNEDRTLDLFGGSGNLSQDLSAHKVDIIDATPEKFITTKNHQSYTQINIFSKSGLSKIKELPMGFRNIIVDPPRSGFKELSKVVDHFCPQRVLYISCNPWTMTRDIEQMLELYLIKSIQLFDLFPGSHHFEAGLLLVRKS